MRCASPRVETRCTHRGASRDAHLAALAELRGRVGRGGASASSDAAPLVLAHCGDRRGRAVGRGASLGCEIVHVRIADRRDLEQATDLVRAAVRFAGEAGDLRGPRRGVLRTFGGPPVEVTAALCPGWSRCGVCAASCPAHAFRADADGRPAASAACGGCGECIGPCPFGAIALAHAPWSAVNARLEALLGSARDRPVALLLHERLSPPAPDEAYETEQPHDTRLLPLEVPRGTLRAGLVLRALELGAAAVYAVVPEDEAPCAASVAAAIAFAQAMGWHGRVRAARSVDGALEQLRGASLPSAIPIRPTLRDPRQRPNAAAIALALWRGNSMEVPLRITGPGAFGGGVAVAGDTCTLCDLCSRVCPTGALSIRRGARVALEFDASLCPGACGRCESACPFGAVTVSPEVRFPPERVTLVERSGVCARCGEPWSDGASMPALASRIGGGGRSALLAFLGGCPQCRSRALGSSLPPRT